MTTSRLVPTLAAFALLHAPAQGAILAYYEITGVTDAEAAAITNFGNGVTAATDLADGAGVGFSADREQYVSYGQWTSGSNIAGSITQGAQINFTLTVGSTATSFTSFDFVSEANTTDHPSGASQSWALFYSTDGFATAPASGDEIGVYTRTASGTESVSLDLSSITALQNVTNQSISFRLYAYDNVNTGGTTTVSFNRINDITVNGIPEPTTSLLAGLAGLVLLRRRRV